MLLPVKRRRVVARCSSSSDQAAPITEDEDVLAVLLQRYHQSEIISVSDANRVLTARSGFRNNQVALCRLFDLAASLGCGQREGEPAHAQQRGGSRRNPLQLRLSLAELPVQVRERLRLMPASTVSHPYSQAGTFGLKGE